jgi:hypothetical protein
MSEVVSLSVLVEKGAISDTFFCEHGFLIQDKAECL